MERMDTGGRPDRGGRNLNYTCTFKSLRVLCNEFHNLSETRSDVEFGSASSIV